MKNIRKENPLCMKGVQFINHLYTGPLPFSHPSRRGYSSRKQTKILDVPDPLPLSLTSENKDNQTLFTHYQQQRCQEDTRTSSLCFSPSSSFQSAFVISISIRVSISLSRIPV